MYQRLQYRKKFALLIMQKVCQEISFLEKQSLQGLITLSVQESNRLLLYEQKYGGPLIFPNTVENYNAFYNDSVRC